MPAARPESCINGIATMKATTAATAAPNMIAGTVGRSSVPRGPGRLGSSTFRMVSGMVSAPEI